VYKRQGLTGISFDWIGSRNKAYVFSGVLIAAGIVSMVVRGFDLGVDFKGGYSYNVTFDSSVKVSADELRNSLKQAFGGQTPVVKSVDTDNTFNIVTSYLISAQEEDGILPEDRVMEALYNGIKGLSEKNLSIEAFKATDSNGTHVTSFSKVGPTIADDIMRSALFAGLFALLLIFLYLFLRFSRWEYSLGAVGALFHDTLVTLSIFSLLHGVLPFSMEIDQAFIAAILTVIGYSINDTVVVFDRIREFLHNYSKSEPQQVINNSINTTLSRTLLTSLTTLFVVFVLFFFGGASIKGFAFALLVGITVGTYSSVFVAAPLMYDFSKKRGFSAKKDTTAAGDDLRKPFSKAAHKA
jgi:SecD/SecF fusion protein